MDWLKVYENEKFTKKPDTYHDDKFTLTNGVRRFSIQSIEQNDNNIATNQSLLSFN